eukprot:TRINITY_DN49955_c0_g1_i1.p1 TRINITY_DN49955_c0_g1~~TRINITY_DN49955_c0_g1_i1.p1  ORF type:complete len:365 (-),score=70.52 TRINITY_DN49955_c0_g1_i1:163-1164(-)
MTRDVIHIDIHQTLRHLSSFISTDDRPMEQQWPVFNRVLLHDKRRHTYRYPSDTSSPLSIITVADMKREGKKTFMNPIRTFSLLDVLLDDDASSSQGGSIVEIVGPASSGKTQLAHELIASMFPLKDEKRPVTCAYIDVLGECSPSRLVELVSSGFGKNDKDPIDQVLRMDKFLKGIKLYHPQTLGEVELIMQQFAFNKYDKCASDHTTQISNPPYCIVIEGLDSLHRRESDFQARYRCERLFERIALHASRLALASLVIVTTRTPADRYHDHGDGTFWGHLSHAVVRLSWREERICTIEKHSNHPSSSRSFSIDPDGIQMRNESDEHNSFNL